MATLTIFKLIAIICSVGTSSEDCRPSMPPAHTFYGGETNLGGEACLRSGPPQVASAVADGRIKYEPQAEYIKYSCPAYGTGKVTVPDYGVVAEPHVQIFGENN
jgi:hypothetical protein